MPIKASSSLSSLTGFFLAGALAAGVPQHLTDVDPANPPKISSTPETAPPSTDLVPTVVFVSSRTAFNAAAPGLPCEDFEEMRLASGGIVGVPAPLNSTTSNAYFLPGEIVPGVNFRDEPINATGGGSSDGLAYLGAAALGSVSKTVVANSFVDSFVAEFNPPVTAVGFDAIHFFATGSVTVQVFGPGGVPYGSVVTAADPTGSNFVGLLSTVPIASLVLTSANQASTGAEGADNICFGQNPRLFQPAQPIPTLGTWGLAALVGLLFAGALWILRIRSR